jgi:YegS/Rv2252/BmrU family lipid kinase
LSSSLAGVGRALVLAQRVADLLKVRHIAHEVFRDDWPENFESFTDVWIVGGDGTMNYFVNRYPDLMIPLGLFAGGTGNDFHWLLYGKQTPEEQVVLMLQAQPRSVDLGKCNDRYFINGVGIGFEGVVARALTHAKKLPGKTSFLLTVIRKIFSYRSRTYKVEANDQVYSGKYLLVDISNGRRAGGGFHIAPEARADDGYFDVVISEAMGPLKRLRYLPVIEKGKHLKKPFIRHFLSQSIRIESEQPLEYHLDGEYACANGLKVEILRGRLLFRF